jgi:hypothetical protein
MYVTGTIPELKKLAEYLGQMEMRSGRSYHPLSSSID